MASEGYVVYVLTAKVRGTHGGELLRLDDVDGNGTWLASLLEAEERTLWGRPTPERRARFESAYRFDAAPGFNRPAVEGAWFSDGESGRYGRAGRMVHVETGDGRAFASKEAALIPLRAGYVSLPGERYALLFLERRGGSTLKQDYEEAILKPVERRHRLTIRLEAHVDRREWERFLGNAQVAEVKAVWRSMRREDYGPTTRGLGALTVGLQGSTAVRVGGGLLSSFLGALRRGEAPDSYLVGELRPRDDDEYEHQRTVVKATADGVTRSVVFTEDGLPQWIYDLDSRLAARSLRELWLTAAPRLLAPYLSERHD